jgi:hypothetical protein
MVVEHKFCFMTAKNKFEFREMSNILRSSLMVRLN